MITDNVPDRLAETLFGKSRRLILALLYSHTDEQFYLRRIVRETGAGLGPVQRELKLLTAAGIIERQERDRLVYYRANRHCPIFTELKRLAVRGIFSSSTFRRNSNVEVPRNELATFCRRHHIKRLSFFGSVLREDSRSDSDVDVLVEFEPGHTPGWDIVSIEDELSSILSRKVDMHTRDDLSRYFRDRVVREAKVQYSAE
jgi:predicted nucleotidyltransferase